MFILPAIIKKPRVPDKVFQMASVEPVWAISFRDLGSPHISEAMQIVRHSDSLALDQVPENDPIKLQAELRDFAGASDLSIAKFVDHSSNGWDLVNSNLGQQYKIYLAGTDAFYENEIGCIAWQANSNRYDNTAALIPDLRQTGGTIFIAHSVFISASVYRGIFNFSEVIFCQASGADQSAFFWLDPDDGTTIYGKQAPDGVKITQSAIARVEAHPDKDLILTANGVASTGTNNSIPSVAFGNPLPSIRMGRMGTAATTVAHINEIIAYDKILSDDEIEAISNNQRAYYGTS